VEQLASYTMELRNIIEMYSQDDETLSHKDRIEIGRKELFNFEYPIFDPLYKGVFETNFIRKFYMREIGFETEGLFKFQLETWLLINMPYFNKMYQSELLDFDPLVNNKVSSTSTRNKDIDGTIDTTKNIDSTKTNNQQVDGTQGNTNFNRHLESDTPDGRLAITTLDGAGVIEYASHITEDTGKSDSTTTNSIDGTTIDDATIIDNAISDITELETFVETREGKTGSQTYSKMLTEYRESLVRVENKMFEEMQQLFMLVY
jgi:hypothetical protein